MFKDLLGYMNARKKWVLLPVIIMLVFVAALVIIAGHSSVAPFIYTLF